MFTNSLIVFRQILVMYLLMAAGYYLFRRDILDNATTKRLSLLLNKYVTFFCVLRSFQRPFEPALAKTLIVTLILCALLYVVTITCANLIFRPAHTSNYADRRLSTVLSNNGFMALPLLDAMFGSEGVFLGSASIACMAVVLWTYGVKQLDPKAKPGWRAALLNPGVFGIVLGLILFCSPVKLPSVLYSAVDFMGDLNTPLAMLVLGCFLAQVKLKDCFCDPGVWKTGAVRLLLFPFITMAVLLFLPMDRTAKLTMIISSGAPTAIASAMFGQLYGTDYLFSTRVIALTTLLSAVTLPTLIAIMEVLLHVFGI